MVMLKMVVWLVSSPPVTRTLPSARREMPAGRRVEHQMAAWACQRVNRCHDSPQTVSHFKDQADSEAAPGQNMSCFVFVTTYCVTAPVYRSMVAVYVSPDE